MSINREKIARLVSRPVSEAVENGASIDDVIGGLLLAALATRDVENARISAANKRLCLLLTIDDIDKIRALLGEVKA